MAKTKVTFGIKDHKKKLKKSRPAFRKFLNRTEKSTPRGINLLTVSVEKEVWKEVDCLSCANCCKKMTPTFSKSDIRRISAHFGQTPQEFYKKWLMKDSNKDTVNKKLPCQFLDLKTNKCSIYSIRPSDCAGFPHLTKKPWKDYAYIHKQNIDYCPATFRMIEKLIGVIEV